MVDDDFEDNGRDGRAGPAEQMSYAEYQKLRDGGYPREAADALADGRVKLPGYIARALAANERSVPLGARPVLVRDVDQPPRMDFDQWQAAQRGGRDD